MATALFLSLLAVMRMGSLKSEGHGGEEEVVEHEGNDELTEPFVSTPEAGNQNGFGRNMGH
eukprot:12931067-Prorocentrum_lima.AAC.1